MSRRRLTRSALIIGALVATSGTTLPAVAESGGHFAWAHRDDGRGDTPDRTFEATDLRMYAFNGQVTLVGQDAEGQYAGGIEFIPPVGQTLESGTTYRVGGPFREPTATTGQVITHRDGRMCGRTEEELSPAYTPPRPAVGWFRVDEIERTGGVVVAFAATYEVSCQYVDGPLGFEGSISYDASQPTAPIPPAPDVPSAVADLEVHNTNPDSGGTSTTTLNWTNPASYGDLTVDMVQLCCDATVPALVGGTDTRQWRGRASSYHDGHVEFMDGRRYRVVPRGPSGRVGVPVDVTIIGSRMDIPRQRDLIQIGQQVSFSGRLTKSSDLATANAMSGPALPGRTLVLCQQDVAGLADARCNEVDRAVSGADGRFTLATAPVANSWYSVRLPSSDDLIGNWSYVLLSSGVAPQTDLRIGSTTTARTTVTVRRGSVIRFNTSRARRGSTGIVRLQRLTDGKWRTIASRRVGTRTGRLSIPFREYRRGLLSYRVVKLADARHVNGFSRVKTIRVH